MSKTLEDLQEAFAGESQANRKYTLFAQKADDEGYPQAAHLFRAAARSEAVHASNHLRAMGGVRPTSENLQEAFDGETYEVTTMYPPFIQDAQDEGNRRAASSFEWAWKVEQEHAELYAQMLKSLDQPPVEVEYYVCPVCGHTHIGPPPEKCPVCGTPGKRFEQVL